ncbi:DMT family transporter [Mumia zhuanghuii]|uniref:DMT family transporter n=1 Tax=Mumia zhuanghuii TaxID=2585211 RepID=A0A5C4MJI0_9ACTN|nr:DMT family transporter [Mumia zhuanghuii]TNC43570.1 DMT family transporter [Mumia zhuanghuii]TNC48649.1 DMT family transporter [Mumia zhuanghuii]
MTTSKDDTAIQAPVVRDLSFAALGLTVLLWASAFVGIRAVGETFSPGALSLGRLAVAALALSVLFIPRQLGARREALPRGRTAALILAYGVLWFGAYNVALNAGERHVDAGTAAMLVQLGPILIAVIAGLFLGEGFPVTLAAGLAVGFSGVTLIALGGDGSGNDITGVLLCVLAAVLYAAGVLLQKPVMGTVSPLMVTWLGCVIGVVTCLPFAGQLVSEIGDASTGAILGVVYLGVFPTALAFTVWAYALRRVGAGPASATTYLVPAIAIVLSWLFLSEVPTALGLAGGVLCLLGVAITRMRRRTPR